MQSAETRALRYPSGERLLLQLTFTTRHLRNKQSEPDGGLIETFLTSCRNKSIAVAVMFTGGEI
jgi:hypothetical protein